MPLFQLILKSDVDCIDVLSAAGFLAMDDLINACCKSLEKQISVKNCLRVEQAADISNVPWLSQAARQFALSNFEVNFLYYYFETFQIWLL